MLYLMSSHWNCCVLRYDGFGFLEDQDLPEFLPWGVSANARIALDHVRPVRLDETEAPVAALVASWQDAASHVRGRRAKRTSAKFIERAARALPN